MFQICWFCIFLNPAAAFQTENPVDVVKRTSLDINPEIPLGKVLAGYRWFALGRWHQKTQTEDQILVTFRGEWPDPPATEDFHKNHRHTLKVSLLAMQLDSYYQLSKDKDRMAFLIDFSVAPDGSFSVVSGRLGIRAKKSQEWRYEDFTDKALLRVIEAIYIDENPYLALCKGLPYR